jgi:predicted O-methyltransferase YrrM
MSLRRLQIDDQLFEYVLACDYSDKIARIDRPFWQRAGLAHKIEQALSGIAMTR